MKTRIDLEQAVIGTILFDPTCYAEVSAVLKPKLFIDKTLQKVVKFLDKCHRNGESWSTIILADMFPDRADFIYDLSHKSLMYSQFIQCVNRLVKHGLKSEIRELIDTDPDFDMNELEGLISASQPVMLDHKEQSTEDVFKEVIDYMDDVGHVSPEMPTHYKMINNCIDGFMRQQIMLIIASTSNSKTVFMWNMLLTCIQAMKKIVVVDLEMTKKSLIIRLAAMIYKIPLDWMTKGKYLDSDKLLSKDDRKYVKAKLSELAGYYADNIMIVRKADMTELRQIVNDFRPDIVCIDTIQSFCQRHPMPSGMNKADQITTICKKLNDLCIDTNIAMIQTAQVNRNTDNRVPTLSDISESSGIANNAAYAIGVRDKFMNLPDEANRDVYDVNLCKVRHGKLMRMKFFMNKEIALISEFHKVPNYEQERSVDL